MGVKSDIEFNTSNGGTELYYEESHVTLSCRVADEFLILDRCDG